MSKNKKKSGLTKQGVRDLSYLKGRSVGRKYEPPPSESSGCDHYGLVREVDANNGISKCSGCSCHFGFDGRPL